MKSSKFYTLKNGLRLIFYQDTSKHSTYAELIVNYGAINNEFILDNKNYHINDGMSHFLEHLLIEHSIYGNAIEYFQNNYVEANGRTSLKDTRFYIQTVNDFEVYLEMLIKMVNIPAFSAEDIEKTKYAIYEEIRKDNDNKFSEFNKIERKCLFKSFNFSSVLGSIEELKNINYETVKMCYDLFYQPKNQILAIAGNIDIDKTIKFIEKIYDEINKKDIIYSLPKYKEPNNIVKFTDSVYKNVTESFIRITYKINISNLEPYEKVKLSFYLDYFLNYNFNESSNTYKKLIDDKISVSNIGYGHYIINDFLIINISTYTNKFDEFIELITNTIKNKKVDEEDFEIRKKRTIIDLILREENMMKMLLPFLDNVITFNYFDIDKVEDIEEETYEDFIDIINSLDFSNYCIIKMLKKSTL